MSKFTEDKINARWFSAPQETIDAAERLHKADALFEPAAVFKTPTGRYVMGLIREKNWPPADTAKYIMETLGYEMVSCCDPLMFIWRKYPLQPGQ